jgi:hypothetical protein
MTEWSSRASIIDVLSQPPRFRRTCAEPVRIGYNGLSTRLIGPEQALPSDSQDLTK